jgi:hypothetical protein
MKSRSVQLNSRGGKRASLLSFADTSKERTERDRD